MSRRAILIVNAKSRSGAAQSEIALERLKAHGIDTVHLECGRREDLSPLIVENARDVDCAIVGGGDGTLNAAAFGVIEAGLPLGILPLGTANDLARTLGLPTAPDEAARVIVAGHKARIDVGEVNGIFYFNVASIGFSARLARRLTSEAKRRFGALGCGPPASRLSSASPPIIVEIEHDGTTERPRAVRQSLGNRRCSGGGRAELWSAPD